MRGDAKKALSKEGRKAQIERFTYNGVPVHKLPSVGKIQDMGKQLKEIEKRLEAMAEYCDANGLIMTPLHMVNALGVSEGTYKTMLRARRRDNKSVEFSSRKSDAEIAAIKARAELLTKWEALCNQWCLDTVAKDNQFGRSIYVSKAVFHNWDTPQNESVVGSSIEIILGKANRVKVRQEQQAREKKGDDTW